MALTVQTHFQIQKNIQMCLQMISVPAFPVFFLCWDWRDLQGKLVDPSWSTSFLKIKYDYGFISLATQQGHQQLPHQRHLGATSRPTTLLPTHHSIILQESWNNKQNEMQVPWVCLKMIHSSNPFKQIAKQVAGSLGDPKNRNIHIWRKLTAWIIWISDNREDPRSKHTNLPAPRKQG